MSGDGIMFEWNGEAMLPASPGWGKRADKAYVIGERYHLEQIEARSGNSHRHYHAAVNSAWANLPAEQAERFPTADHLRRYALIKAGYCDQMTMPCPSQAAALRFAAMARSLDEYALVTATNAVVTIYRAKSQSYKAMSKTEFQESKDKVLDILSGMIGVTVAELRAADAPTPAQYLAAG